MYASIFVYVGQWAAEGMGILVGLDQKTAMRAGTVYGRVYTRRGYTSAAVAFRARVARLASAATHARHAFLWRGQSLRWHSRSQ